MTDCYKFSVSCAEYNVAKEKQRLQNLMTYGSDLEPAATTHTRGLEEKEEVEEKDRFDEGMCVDV